MYDGRNQGTAQPRSQRAEGTQCVLGALHVLLLLLLVWVGSRLGVCMKIIARHSKSTLTKS